MSSRRFRQYLPTSLRFSRLSLPPRPRKTREEPMSRRNPQCLIWLNVKSRARSRSGRMLLRNTVMPELERQRLVSMGRPLIHSTSGESECRTNDIPSSSRLVRHRSTDGFVIGVKLMSSFRSRTSKVSGVASVSLVRRRLSDCSAVHDSREIFSNQSESSFKLINPDGNGGIL